VAPQLEIPLARAIQSLRRELLDAVAEGEGSELRFSLGPVELELQLEVSTELGGEAGAGFWVLKAGGKASRSDTTTHTLRLTLKPVDEDFTVRSEVQDRPE
jgi:hypothetical protein